MGTNVYVTNGDGAMVLRVGSTKRCGSCGHEISDKYFEAHIDPYGDLLRTGLVLRELAGAILKECGVVEDAV